MKNTNPVLPLAICLAASTGAHAAFTLVASEDNNVKRDSAVVESNGATLSLKEAKSSQGNARIGFFKFDLAGKSALADGADGIFSISLSSNAGTTFTLKSFVLSPGAANFNWTDGAINWDNRPAPSTDGDENFVSTTLATAFGGTNNVADATASGASFSFSLPDWESYLQTDDSITFILLATTQGTTGPSLSIATSADSTASRRPTFTSVPEPSSTAFLLLGSLYLIRRKR